VARRGEQAAEGVQGLLCSSFWERLWPWRAGALGGCDGVIRQATTIRNSTR
jgi:hypothetical protein